MINPIKVAIADDHGLMRQGLASMLESVSDISIVGLVSGGEEAVNLISTKTPDVFLMDIVMRGMTGIEAARWITDANPSIKVILISGELNREYISTGIKAGIAGYLLKDVDRETLINAIRTVVKGEKFFIPEVMTYIFQDYYQSEIGQSAGKKKTNTELTKRETEILRLIAQGDSLKKIAEKLFISVKTVETHHLNIKSKLNLSNTAQLVRYAIENGIISM